MPEREKVIRGLEFHKKVWDNALSYRCENEFGIICPYEECRPGCTRALAVDALALLKEREAVEPKTVQSKDFLWSQWYVCGACEHPVDPGDKFCRHCGRAIKWEDSDAE